MIKRKILLIILIRWWSSAHFYNHGDWQVIATLKDAQLTCGNLNISMRIQYLSYRQVFHTSFLEHAEGVLTEKRGKEHLDKLHFVWLS